MNSDELRALGQQRLPTLLNTRNANACAQFWHGVRTNDPALVAGAATFCGWAYADRENDSGNLPLCVAVKLCQDIDAVDMVRLLRNLGARVGGHAGQDRNGWAMELAVGLALHEKSRHRTLPVIRALLQYDKYADLHREMLHNLFRIGWPDDDEPPIEPEATAVCLQAMAEILKSYPDLREVIGKNVATGHYHDIMALPVWDGFAFDEKSMNSENLIKVANNLQALTWVLAHGVDGRKLLLCAIDRFELEAVKNLAKLVDPNQPLDDREGVINFVTLAERNMATYRDYEEYSAKAQAVYDCLITRATAIA